MSVLRKVEFKEGAKTQVGLFHQWYTEVIDTTTNFLGVVEDVNGNVKFINAVNIRFTDGLLHGFNANIKWEELCTTEVENIVRLFSTHGGSNSGRAFILYYSNVEFRDTIISILRNVRCDFTVEYSLGNPLSQTKLMRKIEDGLTEDLILTVRRGEEVKGVLANRCISLNPDSVPNPLLVFSDVTNKPILFQYATESERNTFAELVSASNNGTMRTYDLTPSSVKNANDFKELCRLIKLSQENNITDNQSLLLVHHMLNVPQELKELCTVVANKQE